jgi:tetratricopeptide (TPR) repeat protein
MKKRHLLLFMVCLQLVFCASTQKKIERERERDPIYQYNLGLFHLNEGDPDKALEYFRKSLNLKENNYLVYHAMGLAYSMKGNFEESAKKLEKCLQINPKSTETRNVLGAIYQEMGFLDKAEFEYKKTLEDTNYMTKELPYYNLARLCFIKDDLNGALEHVNSALGINNRMVLAHNLKGVILEKQNRLPEAIASYSSALRLTPDDDMLKYNLAVSYFKNADYARAKPLFEEVYPRISDPELKKTIKQYLDIIDKQ